MSGRYRLQKAHRQAQSAKQDELNLIAGELGLKLGGSKVVEVANRPGYVYVRLRSNQSEVVQAFNDKVALVYGLPVLVAIDPRLQSRYYIYGRDIGRYVNWGSSSAYLPVHGSSHSFNPNSPGNDIVYVYGRQYMPFAVTPSGSSGAMSAWIYPGTMYRNNTWYYAGGTGTPSFVSYKPTGSTARMVLIYLDDGGNPHLVAGDHFDASVTGSLGVYEYIPDLPSLQDVPLAAVRLVSGTSTVLWDNIYDVRLLVSNASVSSGTSGGYTTVQNEGSNLTQRSKINVIGSGLHAYDDPTNAVTIISGTAVSISGGHVIQDDGVDQTQRANLNFVGSGFVIYDDGGATIVSGTAVPGSQGSPGAPGIPGGTTLIYDDNVFLVSGTAISFQSGLDVTSTGTVAYVTWTGTSADLLSAVILAPNSLTRNRVVPTEDYPALILRQFSPSQTQNVFEVQTATGTVLFGADQYGRAFAYGPAIGDNYLTRTVFGNGAGPTGTASSAGLIAIGYHAAQSAAAAADYNVAIGYEALLGVVNGENNIGIGYSALDAVTSGNNNTGVGHQAGSAMAGGVIGNTAIGAVALGGNTASGNYNTAVGNDALKFTTGASVPTLAITHNTVVGADAGSNSPWLTNNVFIGYQAGYTSVSGTGNVYIGYQAGEGCVGDSNIFIGNNAGWNFAGSNMLVIANDTTSDPLISGDFSARSLAFDQITNDGHILDFRSTGDVAHGITNVANTSTFGYFSKTVAANGGLNIVGLTEATVGLRMAGVVRTTDTAKTATASAAFEYRALLSSGTSTAATMSFPAGANIFAFRAFVAGAERNLAIIDADGDLNLDATVQQNVWDDYDDVALLTGVRALGLPAKEQMEDRWRQWVDYARPVLEQTGVVTYNEDGHHYVATRRLNMLQIDAIRQLSDQVRTLKSQLQSSENRFNQLMDKLDRLGIV